MTSGSRFPSGLSWGAAMSVTACGVGYLRPASGSWGSLPPVAVVAACVLADAEPWTITASLLLLVGLGSIACIRFGAQAERAFGAKDPSSVVADEVAGCALTLAIVPWWIVAPQGGDATLRAAATAGIAFFLFRVFDVWKPGFVGSAQSKSAGWGILLDDLGAAICAWPLTLVGAAMAMSLPVGPPP